MGASSTTFVADVAGLLALLAWFNIPQLTCGRLSTHSVRRHRPFHIPMVANRKITRDGAATGELGWASSKAHASQELDLKAWDSD